MPKITGFLAKLSFNQAAYESELHKQLEKELYRAWDAWLNVFLDIVPVWTGESVGAILPLANIIGRTVTVSPASSAPGNRSVQGAGQSSAKVNIGGGRASITFTTNIDHLIVNEYIDARIFGFALKKPGPYDFQGMGKLAFLAVASTARIPSPADSLDVKLEGLG